MAIPKEFRTENSRSVLMYFTSSNSVSLKKREPNKVPQFLAAFAATISAVCLGMCLSWSSSALPMLYKVGSVTEAQGAWVGSILTLGAIIGAVPTGPLANAIGRKRALQVLMIPMFFSWIIIAYLSKSVAALYAGRLLAGIATGGISVAAPMYVAELSHMSIRGTLGTFFQVQITVGLLIEYILGGTITNFCTLALVSALLPVVSLVATTFLPESPVFLCSKGKTNEARRSLMWFRGEDYDVDEELFEISEQIKEASKNKAKLSDLINHKATTKGLIISLGLMIFQQLSGVNAVLFYTTQIFSEAKSFLSPDMCSIVVGITQVIATLASTVLIDKAGRKILLLVSDFVMCICLAALGFYFYIAQYHDLAAYSSIPLVSVAFFIIFFSIGFGPIPWMIMGEIFPSNVKGIASSVSAAFNWFLAFTVTNQFQNMVAGFGIGVTFIAFSVVCGVGTCFVVFMVPETKGKSVEEVTNILLGKNVNSNQEDGVKNTTTV